MYIYIHTVDYIDDLQITDLFCDNVFVLWASQSV